MIKSEHLMLGLFFCFIGPVMATVSGCDAVFDYVLDMRKAQKAEEWRRQEAQAREQQKGINSRYLKRFLKSGECIDCFLYDVDFTNRQFDSSNLQDTAVLFASAKGASFRNSNFERAQLLGNLDGLDIRGSNVKYIMFSASDSMRGIRLDGLDLRKVDRADSTNWSGAILRGAKLDGVSFSGPGGKYGHFKTSKSVMNVGIGGTYAVGTDFSGASMVETDIAVCNLKDAKFVNANLTEAIVSIANLQGANFNRANIGKASFGGSDATGASFEKVSGQAAEFDETNLTNANFKGADLRRANFKEAIITNTNFEDANLTGAIWVDGRRCKKGSIGECKR